MSALSKIKTNLRSFTRFFGVDIVRYSGVPKDYILDFSDRNKKIYDVVRPYTMTSSERVNALIEAVDYVEKNKIDGAIVECGVWKGGSVMAAAYTLKELGVEDRDIFLYDTFSGMPKSGVYDTSFYGSSALEEFSTFKTSEDSSDWCRSSLDEVKQNVFSINYPKEKIHFIEGKVEDTIPENIPPKIALLRLDTDWYESTKHELVHLFPRLQSKGVLIIDDYGHWRGLQKAADEYFLENNIPILLNRIDYSGRIAVKHNQ